MLDKVGAGTSGSSTTKECVGTTECVGGSAGDATSGTTSGSWGEGSGSAIAAPAASVNAAPAVVTPTAAPAAAERGAPPTASVRPSVAVSTGPPARAQVSRLLPSAAAGFAAAGRADFLAAARSTERGASASRNGSVMTREPTMSSTRAGGKLQKADATNCRMGRNVTAE